MAHFLPEQFLLYRHVLESLRSKEKRVFMLFYFIFFRSVSNDFVRHLVLRFT